jgi:hypothetical protein
VGAGGGRTVPPLERLIDAEPIGDVVLLRWCESECVRARRAGTRKCVRASCAQPYLLHALSIIGRVGVHHGRHPEDDADVFRVELLDLQTERRVKPWRPALAGTRRSADHVGRIGVLLAIPEEVVEARRPAGVEVDGTHLSAAADAFVRTHASPPPGSRSQKCCARRTRQRTPAWTSDWPGPQQATPCPSHGDKRAARAFVALSERAGATGRPDQ